MAREKGGIVTITYNATVTKIWFIATRKRSIIIIRCLVPLINHANFAYLFILLKINKALSRGVRAPDGRLPQCDNYP